MDDNNQQDNSNPQQPPSNNLEEVKKSALDALTPLIANVKDIDPERKFDMCITAMRQTDNKNLAEVALQAALAIGTDEAKASALVELINEINYLQEL